MVRKHVNRADEARYAPGVADPRGTDAKPGQLENYPSSQVWKPAEDTAPPENNPSELERAADALNRTLVTCEETLAELNYGVAVCIDLNAPYATRDPYGFNEEPRPGDQRLHYSKAGGNVWGLYIQRYRTADESELQPVLNAGLQSRRKAAAAFPHLFRELRRARDEQVLGTRKVTEDLEYFLATLAVATDDKVDELTAVHIRNTSTSTSEP